MNILLTGASGFLGRHVTSLLLQSGHAVFAAGRRSLGATSQGLAQVSLDLASGEGLDQVPWSEIDAVIHLAAAGVKAAQRSWRDGLAVNVVGTQRLLAAIKDQAVRKPAVFIAQTFYEKMIGAAPALLENPYIATKAAGSELAALWAKNYEGATVFGVFFQVYGPGDDGGNVLNYAAKELKAGRRAVFGSGRGLRDWIYVTDAASAVVASAFLARSGVHTVDIGTGELVSVRTVVEKMAAIADAGADNLVFDPAKDRPDLDLALAARRWPAGWRPQTDLNAGIGSLYSNT